MGHATTIDYLVEVARRVHEATGLLPHVNPGIMSRADLERLRAVSVSAGLMLESSSARLCAPGGPHYGCPDKLPEVRLETIRLAGEAGGAVHERHPDRHRRDAPRAHRSAAGAARAAWPSYGHLQEIIVQNFRAKPGTRHGGSARALARRASVDDRRGPPDFSARDEHPGAAEPQSRRARSPARRRHQRLGRRLAGHARPRQSRGALAAARGPAPRHARRRARSWSRALRSIRASPGSRSAGWRRPCASPCSTTAMPKVGRARTAGSPARAAIRRHGPRMPRVARSSGRSFAVPGTATRWTRPRSCACSPRAAARWRRCARAPMRCAARSTASGSATSSTATSTTPTSATSVAASAPSPRASSPTHLRGRPYDLDQGEIARRTAEAWQRGATEMCLQGGIHPRLHRRHLPRDLPDGEAGGAGHPRARLLAAGSLAGGEDARCAARRDFLAELQRAGLGSLPGTAAEILDDEVRQQSSARTRSTPRSGSR